MVCSENPKSDITDSPEQVIDRIDEASILLNNKWLKNNRSFENKKTNYKYRKAPHFNGEIPPAYTICKGENGDGMLVAYPQTMGNTEYIRDKVYYNKQGAEVCAKCNMAYVGSDSGVYQRQETFNLLISPFDQSVRDKFLQHVSFDSTFHFLGRPAAFYKGKKLHQRVGFNVGNGQGLVYKGGSNHLNKDKIFPLGSAEMPRFALTPQYYIYAPAAPVLNKAAVPAPALNKDTPPQPTSLSAEQQELLKNPDIIALLQQILSVIIKLSTKAPGQEMDPQTAPLPMDNPPNPVQQA